MNMTNDAAVAQTIIAQLGGARFSVMTGAKDLVSSPDGLTFKLPRANRGINMVTIKINQHDLYNVTFSKISKRKTAAVSITAIEEHVDIYSSRLGQLFTSVTGLYTSL